MTNLIIEATKYTPQIDFDLKNGILCISGRSYPENTAEFYQPIVSWIRQNVQNQSDKVFVFNMDIAYFNSSSSKVFMDIFEMLDKSAQRTENITINWYYDKDDEIILEHGEEFQEDLEYIKFHLVPKTND